MKKLLAVLVLTMFAGWVAAAETPDVTIGDLKAALAAKIVTLLDANGTASWKEGHIPGAIDFAANREKLSDLLPKEKDALIVAYCGGPMCGAYKAAVEAAVKLGYTNVKHLSAGIHGWKEAGEPTQKE